jgi:outer membrane protein OmpA-like peptidoglycan-associated protein/tetratricopeptide (TPR) repeat protein
MKTKLTILSLLILMIFAGVSVAQTSLPKAEQYMQKFEYVKAIDLYLNHFLVNTPNETDIRNISYCYIKINDTKNAENWLSKLIKSGSANSEDIIIYADLLKAEGRYSDAVAQYQKLKQVEPAKSKMADENIKICEDVLAWSESEPDFIVKNEEQFNSANSDFGLVKFGENYLITSDRPPKGAGSAQNDIYGWTGNPYLKLYKVDADKSGNVKDISFIQDLNHEFHNGPGYFDEKTNTLYFTRTKTVKQNRKTQNPDPTAWFKEEADIYTNRLEIYTAELIDGKWQNIKEFSHNNAAMFSVGHPVLSEDAKILYFVSDMPGGVGETDIWYCEKTQSGTWGNPRNAGTILNTAGKEMFPYFDLNGDLYFSSDGHPGMGGLDLFKSSGSKGKWTDPENLKYPINSPKDDFAIIFTETETMGYFSSNRYGGLGSDDIYSFVYSPPPPPVPTELILAVTTYERLDDGTLIPLPGINVHFHLEASTEENPIPEIAAGIYYTTLKCDETYMIHGANPDFFAQSQQITTQCETMNDTVFVQFVFERIVIDKPIVIENIYYDFDKWNIRPDAAVELDKIVALLVENPQIIIELGSHTDSRGSKKYNENLSQKRAESAVQYIISNGIAKDRITAKGYGEYQLVNNCADGIKCSDEEHQMNRRTEFKVTGFSKNQPVIYSNTE